MRAFPDYAAGARYVQTGQEGVANTQRANDAEVMNQTKHKTTDMIRRCIRLDNIRQHNAAQKLGLQSRGPHCFLGFYFFD